MWLFQFSYIFHLSEPMNAALQNRDQKRIRFCIVNYIAKSNNEAINNGIIVTQINNLILFIGWMKTQRKKEKTALYTHWNRKEENRRIESERERERAKHKKIIRLSVMSCICQMYIIYLKWFKVLMNGNGWISNCVS